MSSYIGYRVRVFMQNNATFQGTIAFVDNHLIKLRNGKQNSWEFYKLNPFFSSNKRPKTWNCKRIIIKSSGH